MVHCILCFGFYIWNFGSVELFVSRSQLIARDFTNVSVLLLAQCAACGRGDARNSILCVSNACAVYACSSSWALCIILFLLRRQRMTIEVSLNCYFFFAFRAAQCRSAVIIPRFPVRIPLAATVASYWSVLSLRRLVCALHCIEYCVILFAMWGVALECTSSYWSVLSLLVGVGWFHLSNFVNS